MTLKLQFQSAAAAAAGRGNLKLQLGCGRNLLDGWINTDSAPSVSADYLDCARPLPFGADVFEAVFCEHTIEHIPHDEANRLIKEVFRILRPGGVFRVVTPSLETFCRMVLEPNAPEAQTYLAWFKTYVRNPDADMVDAINLCFYGHGHRHIYSAGELDSMLRGAGFQNTILMRAESYSHAVFNGVDGHGKVVGAAINAIEAMAIEAVKPMGP